MRSLINRFKKRFSGAVPNLEALVLMVPIVGCMMLIALGVSFVHEQAEQRLLETTPLAETHYWYSLDNFPKYKLEAAEMVEEQMESGLSKEEACEMAINATSDKIYADIVEFTNENPDIEPEDWDTELAKYIAKTQK